MALSLSIVIKIPGVNAQSGHLPGQDVREQFLQSCIVAFVCNEGS